MIKYYNTTEFIINKFKEHPLTNTVVFGNINIMDVAKMNIYPLVHIVPRNVKVGGNVIQINFEIAVVTNRNDDNKLNNDKLTPDNLIDNLNECFSILHQTIYEIKNNNNDLDLQIISDNEVEPIIFEQKNILDGWFVEIEIEIPSNEC